MTTGISADARLVDDARRVDDVMVTSPKTWPAATTTVAEAVEAFTDHVHLLLLVDGSRLVATLAREDLEDAGADDAGEPAADLAEHRDGDRAADRSRSRRTVLSGTPLEAAREQLEREGVRRVAVVDEAGELLGLLCLKRHRRGFCSDAGVAARAAERA